jgi:hypothetical protein
MVPKINLDISRCRNMRICGERAVYRLQGLKHAPFWEASDVFDELLRKFVDDVAPR